MPDARRKGRQSRTLSPGREFRQFAAHGLEVRSASSGDGIAISGMPIVYNAPYRVMDWLGEFEETMMPGVATGVLASGADVRFLFNHDGLPLARTASGTLTLEDSALGLRMTATLDARQQLANDLAVAIERGDVSQMSCGFVVALDEWNDAGDERSIYRFDQLFDVSAVTYPASPTTSIELGLRSMFAMPVESRARVRLAYRAAQEARAGKVLSAENAGLLQQALEALHAADDVDLPSIVASLQTVDKALDEGQAAISAVMDKANPDDDEDSGSAEEASSDPDETEDGTDGTAGQGQPGIADGTGSRDGEPEGAEVREDAAPAEALNQPVEWRSPAPGTATERRAADRSFNDIQRALNDAIKARFQDTSPDADSWCDLWIEDCGTDWVVFHSWEDNPGVGMWRLSYQLDDSGQAVLGDDLTQVVEQSSYVPVEQPMQRSAVVALELEAEQLRLRGKRHAA